MATDTLYENDFFAWTEQQAEVLRRAAREGSNLPLDWENLAEEILRHLLAHGEPVALAPLSADEPPSSSQEVAADDWFPEPAARTTGENAA